MYPALERFIQQQRWLDDLGEPLQAFIGSLFSGMGAQGKGIRDALNGTWLGHPLHPVLTDVPVGAWVTSLVLDGASSASGSRELERASDIVVATGLAAAVGAAATGWTDWSDTYGKERRVGLLHGLLMGGTTALYGISLAFRLSGHRKTGLFFSNIGVTVLSAGAYLGGDEVYDIGYGVNHTAFDHASADWVAVGAEDELQEDTPKQVDAGGTAVMLVKHAGEVHALADTCVHAGCSLAGGKVDGDSIICPCHGSQYRLRDGSVMHGPATMPEPYYDVRLRNGAVEVRAGQ